MARPPHPQRAHKAFWRQVAAGASVENAALAVGVSRPVGYRWFAASGGVMLPKAVRDPGSPSRAVQGRRLTQEDREEIAHLKRLKKTNLEIAEAIGFHAST